MKKCIHVFRISACAAVLAAGPVLTGCSGVVKNLNSAQVNIPNISVGNPLGLDSKSAAVTLSAPQAPASLSKAHLETLPTSYTFPNQNPVSLSTVKSAKLSFKLLPAVTLDGAGPSTFTLTTFRIVGTVADGSGSVTLAPLQIAGPISFTKQSDGSYLADAGTFQLDQATSLVDPDLSTLIGIVTGGPQDNTATLTLTAAATGLSSGTVLHVTFDTTTLTIKSS